MSLLNAALELEALEDKVHYLENENATQKETLKAIARLIEENIN